MIPHSKIGDAVETAILWYRKNGYRGERLGQTIDRVGIASLEVAIRESSLLYQREEILSAELLEKPTV